MKVFKNLVLSTLLILLSGLSISIWSESNFSWEFPDTEIRDALFAISLDSGISISADDTVSGKVNFRFSGSDFDEAFDSFITSSKLYVQKSDKLWTVSRVLVSEQEGVFSVDCTEAGSVTVIDRISRKLGINITYEILPSLELTLHIKAESKEELLENLIRFFPGFILEKNGDAYHIAKKILRTENTGTRNYVLNKNPDGSFKVNVKDALFSNIMETLFSYSGKSFCFLGNAEVKASQASFVSDSFEKTLSILCSQNNFEFSENDGIIYILSAGDTKTEIVTGQKTWEFFQLNYVSLDSIIPLLQKRFQKTEFVSGGKSSGMESGFWARVSAEEKNNIIEFLSECDIQKKTYLIPLKFIKADDFLKRLPPSVDRNSVTEADGNCCIYFSGTEESYKKIMEDVKLCDRPQIRLKYDLLILQYDDTSENKWAVNSQVRKIQNGELNSIAANLGSVLGLNLNVLSVFGLDFAVNLQNSISDNKTRVFADTTLFGVAGKEINFTNTNTYRYRDNNLDPETGKPVYTGVTREIVSGLKLEIKPWVGEDGMITSSVKASVSRRGTDTSSVTGNPPPTSEKIVTTEVCGRSGEPVVLSGLVQNNESEETSRTPFLSKIPLIGKLFKSESKNIEKTQMVIYLVPFIEDEENCESEKIYDEEWLEKRKEDLCKVLNSN